MQGKAGDGPAPWVAAYSRKSRHLDKEIPERELFDKHRALLVKKAAEDGIPLPEARIFMEVGSSESVAERPLLSALLAEVDALPLRAGGHLIIVDPDRLTRANLLEQAQIYDRLQRAGIVLHQVIGGECDLSNFTHEMMLRLKGMVSRWLIQEYKVKVAATQTVKRDRGEPRNGRCPWGYWNDHSEKLPRDRIKPDHRHRDATGLTPFEKLQRICVEIIHESGATLARRYNVPKMTIFSALASPTIAGWPATRFYRDPERQQRSNQCRKLPRDQWIWPKQAGTYEAACTLDEWWAIQEALTSRKDGQVKTGGGTGICRSVVCFERKSERIILATMNDTARTLSYRQCCRPVRDVPRTLVDAAARDWLQALMEDDGGRFFAWMTAEYYHRRSKAPLPQNEELARLDAQVRRWEQELATVGQWACEAETKTEERQWREQVRHLAGLIEATEETRAAIRRRCSPIAQVDRLMPQLLALQERWKPHLWAHYWPEFWAGMPAPLQQEFVEAFIGKIEVRWLQARPRAHAKQEIAGVAPSEFVLQARQEYERLSVSVSACQSWRAGPSCRMG